MTTEKSDQATPLRRSRDNRIFGGVCGGIAESLHIDPLMVRLAAILIGLFTGGTALLAYLVCWVLIPATPGDQGQPRQRTATPAPRPGQAWAAVADDLRSLTSQLRRTGDGQDTSPHTEPALTSEAGTPPRRSTIDIVDSAMTQLGQRLRTAEVKAHAQQTATDLSTAIRTSVRPRDHRAPRETDNPKDEANQSS